jgi:hypothetical protein
LALLALPHIGISVPAGCVRVWSLSWSRLNVPEYRENLYQSSFHPLRCCTQRSATLWCLQDVVPSDAARTAELDPRSLDFDAVLSYLVDVGLLAGTGGDRYRITVAGITEVQRRPHL